jgi:LuxR family maltose regulon positive regulatory protein
MLDFAEERGAGGWLSLANVYSGLADLLRERGEAGQARALAEEALRRAERWRSPSDLANAYLTLASVLVSSKEAAPAALLIAKARRLVESEGTVPGIDIMIASLEAKMLSQLGDSKEVPPALAALTLLSAPAPNFIELLRIAECRLRLVLAKDLVDELARAIPILDTLEAETDRLGRRGRLIEVLVLRALARSHGNDSESALRDLGRALALAEPEGHVRIFLDEGESLIGLLEAGIACRTWTGSSLAYAERLLPKDGQPA